MFPARSVSVSTIALGVALLPLGATPAFAHDHGSEVKAVLSTYADIAHAMYADSLVTAEALKTAVDALIANPSAVTLAGAKGAWLAAREPYQQTEVYRFGNALVDDWEGKVNAWPLDEGLIDYVDNAAYGAESDENLLYTANVIANPVLTFGGTQVDASHDHRRPPGGRAA